MYVTLRMQKTKELVNNPISNEALELIGYNDGDENRKPTDKVFVGFNDSLTQSPLKNWLKEAGITKHITYHCSRHTLGSLQVEAGTSVYIVQHILGHKNVATTQIYAAMADSSKRESVDKITLKSAKIAQMFCTTIARAQYNQVNDIAYRETATGYAQERCKLDVYYPTEVQDAPVVVWFHGGGIEGGEKHIDPQLKNSGIVVVAANYRLLPKAPIDDILDDAAAAVAWTYKNIAKYNGSKRKIFVAGHSAGGYLLDMIGLDKHWLAKYGVDADSLAALVPFSGQCVTHYNIRKQQGIGPLQATIDQYAPLTYIRPDAPPIVIISGDRELELFGRYEEQAYFWRMLKLAGHKDVTLYEMQGYDHGSMPFPAYKILKDHIRRITEKTK